MQGYLGARKQARSLGTTEMNKASAFPIIQEPWDRKLNLSIDESTKGDRSELMYLVARSESIYSSRKH